MEGLKTAPLLQVRLRTSCVERHTKSMPSDHLLLFVRPRKPFYAAVLDARNPELPVPGLFGPVVQPYSDIWTAALRRKICPMRHGAQ